MDVKLSAGDHGYPELSAELIMQLAQRAHEDLPVRRNRLVARLSWRVRPQSCAKVMLGSCRACLVSPAATHDMRALSGHKHQRKDACAEMMSLPCAACYNPPASHTQRVLKLEGDHWCTESGTLCRFGATERWDCREALVEVTSAAR